MPWGPSMGFAFQRFQPAQPFDGEQLREAVLALARRFSIEITPKQAAKVEDFAALLPRATRVFVTFVPGETVDAVIATIHRLAAAGMRPVPHVAARNLRARATFEHLVRGSFAAGAREALVIAGGSAQTAGPFTSSMDLLQTGLFETLGYERLYVAGHPEGSPDIPPDELARALAYKNDWSKRTGIPLEIVTQFGFDAERILAWERELKGIGVDLPVRVGVAGPASIASLLKYAKMCGVRASLGFLQKHGGRMLQMLGHATPDRLIVEIAAAVAQEEGRRIHALHYYPFGGFAVTAAWARATAEGRFELASDGSGFVVAEPH